MPQFCIDQNIKKPLFIAPHENYIPFLWEFHVQFNFDKRAYTLPEFLIVNGNLETIDFSVTPFLPKLQLKTSKTINLNEYDRIIFLSEQRINFEIPNIIYLNDLVYHFINRTYVEIPLLHFLQRNPSVKIILTNCPILIPNENSTEFERNVLKETIHDIRIKLETNSTEIVKTPFDFLGYNNAQVLELLQQTDAKTNLDGSTSFQENKSSLFGIKDGKRMTAYQPTKYLNKIYFIGMCTFVGIGAPFDKTIESYLQKLLNEHNLPYIVENESQFFMNRYQDIFYNLNKLPLKANDIIFICMQGFRSPYFPFLELTNIFARPHNYGEVFVDYCHINEQGNYVLAEKFFEVLTQNNFFKDINFQYPPPPPLPHRYGIPLEYGENISVNAELDAYKNFLRERRLKVGCIVMNANPFTLGHKYLVEYAAARVDKLFIMVVSEDKSEFTFAERFELVRRGTKEFPNVEVLPSGQFVISQKTFSGYFNKENLQDVKVDSSQDVEIFAREIAPTLGVTIRFAGEEPQDTVTRQYNENMKNILPRYNIKFCEIPRRDFQGEVISAKRVRAALKAGDLEKVKALVPATTFEYLREKFGKKSEQ